MRFNTEFAFVPAAESPINATVKLTGITCFPHKSDLAAGFPKKNFGYAVSMPENENCMGLAPKQLAPCMAKFRLGQNRTHRKSAEKYAVERYIAYIRV
jgi:hypothetical protein